MERILFGFQDSCVLCGPDYFMRYDNGSQENENRG